MNFGVLDCGNPDNRQICSDNAISGKNFVTPNKSILMILIIREFTNYRVFQTPNFGKKSRSNFLKVDFEGSENEEFPILRPHFLINNMKE